MMIESDGGHAGWTEPSGIGCMQQRSQTTRSTAMWSRESREGALMHKVAVHDSMISDEGREKVVPTSRRNILSKIVSAAVYNSSHWNLN